jgi:glycosyltransferase involved in cell wall biosynthesis
MVIFYDYYFPAYKAGGPIRSLMSLVEMFSSDGNIYIISSNKDVDGTLLDVPVDEWVLLQGNFIYYSSNGTKKAIESLSSDKREVYYINGIYSVRFSLVPALLKKGRKIISVRGMLHPEALAQKKWKKKAYLLAWKWLRLNRKCEYHATSEIEKNYIENILGKKAVVWVIPNFPHNMQSQGVLPKTINELQLCTLALIGKMKNHHLVLHSLKACKEKITYNIFGAIKDERYWAECQKIIEALPSNITVNYCGSIPPNKIIKVLANCHVYIQPSESENFGHSIIEALSAGRPVITSLNTPWNGLEQKGAGKNISVNNSDSLISLANAISSFAAMDYSTLHRWSVGARNYANDAIDIASIKKQYQEMFKLKSKFADA